MNRPHNNETRLGFAADSTTGLGTAEDVADRSPGATSFVIFDLETTGLCPQSCEIIQIAATRFQNGAVVAGDAFFSYCRPTGPISRFISDYTGITDRDVREAPRPIEMLERFSRFVGDSVIMAHNGHRFDTKFLESTCHQHHAARRTVESIDTIAFSRRLFGTAAGTGHSLDRVMQRLGLSASRYQRHDARGDIQALGDAVRIMRRRLELDHHGTGIPRRETVLPVDGSRVFGQPNQNAAGVNVRGDLGYKSPVDFKTQLS